MNEKKDKEMNKSSGATKGKDGVVKEKSAKSATKKKEKGSNGSGTPKSDKSPMKERGNVDAVAQPGSPAGVSSKSTPTLKGKMGDTKEEAAGKKVKTTEDPPQVLSPKKSAKVKENAEEPPMTSPKGKTKESSKKKSKTPTLIPTTPKSAKVNEKQETPVSPVSDSGGVALSGRSKKSGEGEKSSKSSGKSAKRSHSEKPAQLKKNSKSSTNVISSVQSQKIALSNEQPKRKKHRSEKAKSSKTKRTTKLKETENKAESKNDCKNENTDQPDKLDPQSESEKAATQKEVPIEQETPTVLIVESQPTITNEPAPPPPDTENGKNQAVEDRPVPNPAPVNEGGVEKDPGQTNPTPEPKGVPSTENDSNKPLIANEVKENEIPKPDPNLKSLEYVKNFFSRNEPRSTGATDKIQQYLESRVVFHRIHLAKALENYTKILGAQEVLSVFPSVLDKLSKDEKQVKQQLLLQIPKVVAFLLEAEKNGGALDFVTKWCVPVFARILLENPETEVYDAALLSISEFISVLPQSLLQNELFPLILSFKTDNQETFINILRLLQQILPKVDYKMAKPQIFKLIDYGITSNDSVKKHIIPLLSIISTMIQPDEAQIIKQHLEKLVLDENPEIRAESTSIFPKLSLQLNNDQQLVVLFEKLLNDNLSCSVRSRAATRLGEFICSFKAPIPDSLLGYYHSLITPNTEYTEGENQERLEICAFNFPGVLSATGREGWESLQKTFSLLISHEQEKVKSPIAFSLNEMMPILGPLLTEQFLVPVCETFLMDPKTTDFIKIGIMKNFSKLLEQLSQENRNKFLSYISNIPNEKNWRIKKFILKQLSQIVQLFLNSETLEKVFFPLVFKLQIDKVAAVRNVASLQFSKIVKTLKETELCNMTSFFNQFLELSNCAVYQNRQIFVKICEEILEYDKDLFAATFLPALLELSKDKVDSIRLSLATFFVKTNQSDNFKSNSTISEALDILKNDTNQEVVVLVETILQHQN